ncbi:efflux RND transporter periplasmic adaptor subunit [Mangrovimonas aestuarii]|uniref:efflux RND transporter periplasmic adaptor subunit n=1 Tax=Mangrovimonas aestuarii TaxID=3018443 RepID=UPI002378C043|nr:efflux RND transporter periplasmic adaptor subunit [Mangrovimonas aestuarii]
MSKCYLIILLVLFSCNKDEERIYPQKVPLTESVYSSVTIQPDSLYEIYSAVSGILDFNYLEEGDNVKKGDSIIQVINNTPKLNTENAKLSLQLAKENYQGRAAILDEIEDEILAAQLSYKNDSINYFRQKNLWNQKIGSKMELDNKQLAYELSSNKLSLLKNKRFRMENELETQLKQAQNNYRTSLINTKDFTIKSKINGKVYALYKNPGETVLIQEPLGTVGSDKIFIIEMLIDEEDIVKVALNQKALITLDAYKSKVFEATVDKIYPKKDERSQTFLVEAIFVDSPKVLYPGLSGEGNIIIATKEQALTIPKTYISNNKVLTDSGWVEVVTGLQNLERIEILDGIDETTALVKPKS